MKSVCLFNHLSSGFLRFDMPLGGGGGGAQKSGPQNVPLDTPVIVKFGNERGTLSLHTKF